MEIMDKTFNDLGLSADVLAAVEEMGYTTPTPVQEQTIHPLGAHVISPWGPRDFPGGPT